MQRQQNVRRAVADASAAGDSPARAAAAATNLTLEEVMSSRHGAVLRAVCGFLDAADARSLSLASRALRKSVEEGVAALRFPPLAVIDGHALRVLRRFPAADDLTFSPPYGAADDAQHFEKWQGRVEDLLHDLPSQRPALRRLQLGDAELSPRLASCLTRLTRLQALEVYEASDPSTGFDLRSALSTLSHLTQLSFSLQVDETASDRDQQQQTGAAAAGGNSSSPSLLPAHMAWVFNLPVLPKLVHLDLDACVLDASAISALARLPQLCRLTVGSRVTCSHDVAQQKLQAGRADTLMPPAPFPKLSFLSLDHTVTKNTLVSPKALASFWFLHCATRHVPHLSSLELSLTSEEFYYGLNAHLSTSAKLLAAIPLHLTQLTHMRLKEQYTAACLHDEPRSQMTPDWLLNLTAITGLHSLCLESYQQFGTDSAAEDTSGLLNLAYLTQLRHLEVQDLVGVLDYRYGEVTESISSITDDLILEISEHLTGLTCLRLAGFVSYRQAVHFGGIDRALAHRGPSLSNKGFLYLPFMMKHLVSLRLWGFNLDYGTAEVDGVKYHGGELQVDALIAQCMQSSSLRKLELSGDVHGGSQTKDSFMARRAAQRQPVPLHVVIR